VIGGVTPADRNVISGNERGIWFQTSDTNCTVGGNYIGPDATGETAVGNDLYGIDIEQGNNITVGGTSSGARNVISGNGEDGISFDTDTGSGSVTEDVITGNYIGLDAAGNVAMPNNYGIDLNLGSAQTGIQIGGTASGAGNVISGNTADGIIEVGAATGITIQGNFIGTNATGASVIGNGGNGIYFTGAHNTQIDGTDPGAGNIISGNASNGIELSAGSASTIQGNRIGVLADGATAAGNGADGVYLLNSATQDSIGGLTTSAGNIIANNAGDGIEVTQIGMGIPNQNSIRLNSIYNNTKLGIDLDVQGSASGVSPNDPFDADTGPNDLQNYPVITSATGDASSITIAGTFNSVPSSLFVLDFYGTDAADPSGNGEGKQYIGSLNISTDSAGNATFSSTFNVALGYNIYISATATIIGGSDSGDTSEFAQTVKSNIPLPITTPTSNSQQLQTLKTTYQSLLPKVKSASKSAQPALKKSLAAINRQLNSANSLGKNRQHSPPKRPGNPASSPRSRRSSQPQPAQPPRRRSRRRSTPTQRFKPSSPRRQRRLPIQQARFWQ
jgi:hypothetical protein